ncbi:MAG: type II secretion system protein GspG [Planctomycetota bacterium]
MNLQARRRRGFTLVELMVVILIVGLLAGVVLMNAGGATDDAKVGVARAQVRTFGDAIERYRLRVDGMGLESTLPRELTDLIKGPADFQGRWSNLLGADQIPKDPWGRDYEYKVTDEEAGTFEVRCLGKDGRPGGAPPYDKDIIYPLNAEEDGGQ